MSQASSYLSIDYQLSHFENVHKTGKPHVIALYNFDTGIQEDLEMRVGDIIMLEDVVDESWYFGRSVRTGMTGIFPMNHVEVRIPLTTGLFTQTQPKTQPKSKSNLNGHSNQNCSFKNKPPLLPKSINKNNQSINSESMRMGSLPSRPSKVRVSSLQSKHSSLYLNSNESLSPANSSRITDNRVAHMIAKFSKPTYGDANASLSKQIHSLENNDDIKSPTLHRHMSNSLPVIQRLKPHSQLNVSQLAKWLQVKGIEPRKNKPKPFGAISMYPNVNPSPSPSEFQSPLVRQSPVGQSKLSKAIDMEQNIRPKSTMQPSALMVETLLNKVLTVQHNNSRICNLELDLVSPTLHQVSAFNEDKLAFMTINQENQFCETEVDCLKKIEQPIPCPKMKFITKGHILLSHPHSKSDNVLDKSYLTNQYNTQNCANKNLDEPNDCETTDDLHKSESNLTSDEIKVGSWFVVEKDNDCNGIKHADIEKLNCKVGSIIKCIDANPLDNDPTLLQTNDKNKYIICETWFGSQGLINVSQLRLIDNRHELDELMRSRPRAEVMYSFAAQVEDDLPLTSGDIIYLMEVIDENWYRGQSKKTGKQGLFPITFVRIIRPLVL